MAEKTTLEAPRAVMDSWMTGLKDAGEIEPLETKPAEGTPPPETKPPPQDPPAPKPEPETTTTPPPVVDEDEEKWPRNAKEWKKFKEARKVSEEALRKEADEYKAKATEYETKLKAPNTSNEELEKVKSERDQLSAQLQITSVTEHPKFRAYFEGKTKAQIELAKRIVGTEYADAAEKVLALPEGATRDVEAENLMSNLSGIQQSRFAAVLNSMSQINDERAAEIARAGELKKQMDDQSAAETKRLSTEREQFIANAITSFQDPKTGLTVYQTKEGDNAWNDSVKQRLDLAKSLLTGQAKPDQLVQTIMHGCAFPAVLEFTKGLQAENEKLKKQVAAMGKSTPSLEQSASTETSTEGTPPVRSKLKSAMNPMDAGREFFKVLQQSNQ